MNLRDRLLPLFAIGVPLGALQGLWAMYRNLEMVPDALAAAGIASFGIVAGVLSLVPALAAAEVTHRVSRRYTCVTSCYTACLALASVLLFCSPAGAALEPLAEAGLLGESAALLLNAVLVAAAAVLALRLPVPAEGRIRRLGALSAIVCLGATVPGLVNAWNMQGRRHRDLVAEGPTAPPGAPDVLLVTVDTLRADHLSCYAPAAPPTPAIDRLAAEGARFAEVIAPAPWTLASLASLHTSLPVSVTGAGVQERPIGFADRAPLRGDFVTLAERFGASGWRTGALVGNAFTSTFFGLDQGFRRFDNPSVRFEALRILGEMPVGALLLRLVPRAFRGDDRARGITDEALRWLEEAGEGAPLFLWVHYIDPHAPYESDPDGVGDNSMVNEFGGGLEVAAGGGRVGDRFAAIHEVRSGRVQLTAAERARVRELYAAEVRYTDAHVGRLLDAVRRRGRPTVLAFASDHGEEFWEHDGFEHAHDFYRETVNVPLLLWAPGRVAAGTVVTDPVGLVDLGPTLLDLAGLAPALSSRPDAGRSLRTALSGGAIPPLPRTSTLNLFGLPARLVADGPWRYIARDNGHEELYRVDQDPAERRDVAADNPEVVARLRVLVEDPLPVYLGGEDDGGPDGAAVRNLRALGYVE